MKKKQYKILTLEKKGVDIDNFTIEAIFSTKNEDRHGDVVEQNWDLKMFKKNPVILNSHSYGDATEVIGIGQGLSVKTGKLEGKIKFAVKENPKAKIIFDLYAGGFLNAFSVGFIPKEFDDKGTILKSELLEVSAVSVPSNAYALAKQKGIEVDKLYEKSKQDNKNDITNKDNKKTITKNDDNGSKEERTEDKPEAGKPKGDDKLESKEKKKEEVKEKSAEENGKIEDWYEGEGMIIYRERSLYEFEEGISKFEIKPISPKIMANVGILRGDLQREKIIQSYIFPRKEGWTIDDSKKWLSTKNYDDLWLGKKMDKNEMILKAIANEKNIKIRALNKIYKALELTSNELGKEKLDSLQKQANNRLINKAVKKLLELKN